MTIFPPAYLPPHRYLWILLCLIGIRGYGQEPETFVISEVMLTDTALSFKDSLLLPYDAPMMEDEHFIVSRTCSGEWGGSIHFTAKKTGIRYSARATCPVAVHKLDGKYYVTNALNHGVRTCGVKEIANPRALEVIKLPKPFYKCLGLKLYYFGDFESGSSAGVVALADTSWTLALTAFVHAGRLYQILSDNSGTYVAEVVDGKFQQVAMITELEIWEVHQALPRHENSPIRLYFDQKDAKGYLDIIDDRITVYRTR